LNEARFSSIHRGLSTVAQKVYAAVPIADEWAIEAVRRELTRKGHTIDMHTIRGCMNTLVDSGLVTEPSRGTFSRVAIKEAYKAPAEPKPIKEAKQPEKPMPKQGAIDKLTALSARVRAAMSAMKTLADDIDNAALEIEADILKAGEGAQKYKQLQALLKDLS
jgi:hypothetical protein